MLINRIAFLLIQFRRVGSWQFIEDRFHRRVDVGTSLLAFAPIENQFCFLQCLQQLSGNFFDFLLLFGRHVDFRLREDIKQG